MNVKQSNQMKMSLNIKLQSIPAFFPNARADAHEKMRVRLQFFFVSGKCALNWERAIEIKLFEECCI